MKKIILTLVLVGITSGAQAEKFLGKYSANQYNQDSTSAPYGKYNPNTVGGINSPDSQYGDAYSNESANNPDASNAPKLYDSKGNYRGRLSNDPYDPESISNPTGAYGSDMQNMQPDDPDNPNNPYGNGMTIQGQGDSKDPGDAVEDYFGDGEDDGDE